MKRVLLTNPYGPYDLKWGRAPTDLLNARLARGHGPFNMSSQMPTLPLYLLAENLKAQSTVLDFPSQEDFEREVRSKYDFIAIELKSLHVPRVARMIEYIRKTAPDTQIVVGGYGVSALDDKMPGDKEGHRDYIVENADHLCRREGVRFMREILGDDPIDRPITQYHLPCSSFRLPGLSALEVRSPAILVSLGCPNACDFCNTSAFFYHKKEYVADPAQVYDFMQHHHRRIGGTTMNFILFDEDMFLNPEYVRELGRLIRSNKKTWGYRWITFGSIKALSQFEPEELRECGVGGVWVGVESGLGDGEGSGSTGYSKRAGKSPREVMDGLHKHGILTIASTIVGFDFHNHENIHQDLDYFVSLKPTFYQISPLTPCPGTRLFDKMKESHRLHDDYDWTDFHLWKEAPYDHPVFTDGDVKKYFALAHDKLRTKLGPPLMQFFEQNLSAYETLKDSKSEFLRFQADQAHKLTRALQLFVKAVERHPPSPEVRKRAKDLQARANRLFSNEPFPMKVVRRIAEEVVDWRIGQSSQMGPESGVHAPLTRWAYYDGTGREPLVRKGKERQAIPFGKELRKNSLGVLRIKPERERPGGTLPDAA